LSRILGAAGDPGGAAALIPVLAALTEAGDETFTFAREPAAGMFEEAGFDGVISVGTWAEDVQIAERMVGESGAELLLVATSMNPGPDMAVLREGKRRGVPVVGLLDSWTNYQRRFLGPDERDVSVAAMPEVLGVMDDFAVGELTALGFPRALVRVVGQPAFDGLSRPTVAGRARARKALSVGKQPLVVFFSQSIAEDYGAPDAETYRGYDQVNAAEALWTALADVSLDAALVVKPHPRERVGQFAHLEAEAGARLRVVPSSPAGDLIAAADLVVSMTSITLVEAMLAGRPIISLQPGLRSDDLLVLNRMGVAAPVTDVRALPAAIKAAFAAKPLDVTSALPTTWTDGKGTQRMVALVREMIEQR
jgi:hypothetical protein